MPSHRARKTRQSTSAPTSGTSTPTHASLSEPPPSSPATPLMASLTPSPSPAVSKTAPSASKPAVPVSSTPAAAPPAATSVGSLKHLAFFRYLLAYYTSQLVLLYVYFKVKSGPLKPGIESVEGAVLGIISPLVLRVNSYADVYWQLADSKVDQGVSYVKTQAPATYEFAVALPDNTSTALRIYQEQGFLSTFEVYFNYYLPYIVNFVNSLWAYLLTFSFVTRLVDLLRPYVLHLASLYNKLVVEAKKSDLPLLHYLVQYAPLVPLEKLKKSE